MAKVELRAGDYVLTEGMDEDTYHKVAKAFIEAGCHGDVQAWKAVREGLVFGWGTFFNQLGWSSNIA